MRWKMGNCLDLISEIPDSSIDAIVTDPPFGIGYDYNGRKDVANNPEDYIKWFKPILLEFDRVLKPGGFLAIWQSNKYFKYFWDWFGDDIHIYAGCKNFVQLCKIPINSAFDPIIMKYKNGSTPLTPKKVRRNVDYFVAQTGQAILQVNSPFRDFPCQRPLDQVITILENFVIENGIVLDPFLGSGTILEACEKTNRDCIGFEIDTRWEWMYPKRLKLIEGVNYGEWF